MKAPTERTCENVRPGETEPCRRPWDGKRAGGGIDCCPECRAAANAIGRAVVAILVERAAAMEAATKAA